MNKPSLKIYKSNSYQISILLIYNENTKEYMKIECQKDQLKTDINAVDLTNQKFE